MKEQYWKYSLIGLILILGAVIFRELSDFMGGLLGAVTIYIMVRKHLHYLIDKKKMRNTVAALIILAEVIFCFLIPAFLIIWLLVNKLESIDLNTHELVHQIQSAVSAIQQKTGYDVLASENISKLTAMIPVILQKVLGEISMFMVNAVVLIFILYFMLTGSRQMESYFYDLLPFSEENKKRVMEQVKNMVRSNAIGIPVLAIAQGFIAMIGYMIFGVPNAVLLGFLTCFATIIPLIGTALVWFPAAVFLIAMGNWPAAIGLVLYSLLVISNIDNVLRFFLQKKLANTHPLITIFGVIMGLSIFGFWGVIFGPLLLSMFILCLDLFKEQYLDKRKE